MRRFGVSSVNCAPRRRGWRVAPAVRKCTRKARSSARCVASSGASRTFKVRHARRAEQVARRAGAKSI
ncbi:hypothetical protein A2U01_0109493 [Trifolium medium]|uniref:Uncharacterized protein n=1 Tax=Trifolium medium TaxID=97028 RepID=A0A392VJW7_9FABA|nr:hypothetical protein [Trifolium medium]